MYRVILFGLLLLAGCLPQAGASERGGRLGGRDAPGGGTTTITIVPDGGQYADFEFAPADGTGMGTECACANITDVHGNALTVTQAGTAYCTKGDTLHPASAAGGSMVLCAANKPRVMMGADGSDTTLGILVEDSSANFALRSEAFDNIVWVKDVGLTVSANTQFAPNGAQTADNISNTTGGDKVCQVITTTSANRHSWSVYAHAGSLLNAKLSMTGTGDSAGDRTCTFSGISQTGYTRLTCTSTAAYGALVTAVTACIILGTSAPDTGDMDFWGAQYEDGDPGASFARSEMTSYIPTTSASVVRATDLNSFANTVIPAISVQGSTAATVAPLFTMNGQSRAGGIVMNANAGGRYLYLRNNSTTALAVYDGATETATTDGATINVFKRYWSSWTGSTQTITNATDSATNSGTFDGLMQVTGVLRIGCDPAQVGSPIQGVVKKVCLDHSPTRCR